MSKNWNNDIPPSFPANNTAISSNLHHFPMTNDPAHGAGLSSPHRPSSSPSGGGRSLFPAKLRQILDDSEIEGNQHIVSWLPHGRAFLVHKPKEFAARIIGRYFNHGQYRSFTRQLYHYGFGKVDSGQDMGAFFHPQFLRDKPELAFLIGRRKDSTKKKSADELGGAAVETGSALNDTTNNNNPPLHADHDSLVAGGFGGTMIESPFQALVNETSSRIQRGADNFAGSNSMPTLKDRGISGLLNQLSNEDQEAMIKHFRRSDQAGIAKIPGESIETTSQNFAIDNEAGIGLLFGDDHHDQVDDQGASSSSQPTQSLEPSSLGSLQQQRQGDWFSSIGNFFDDNSYDNDMFGVDFEPRPIEEMILLSYNNFRPNKGDSRS